MTGLRPGPDTSARTMFRDRHEAGRVLARLLEHYRGRGDLLVLGLARGGIPVAWEIAAALDAPLDALIVRKLGAPGHPDFAVGALAEGGTIVLDDDTVRALHLSPEAIREIAQRAGRELHRRQSAYRAGRAPVEVAGRTVILADDGLATGASMRAAIEAVRAGEPRAIVVAVPAAPESTCRDLAARADEVVCASMPSPFRAVGASFWDFTQVSDDQVRLLLGTATTGGAVPPTHAVELVRAAAIPAPRGIPPRDVLADFLGDARIVLIGESTHGTHEFYAARAALTRTLITEHGFTAVAAEADWPDAARVDRYVRGLGTDGDAAGALAGFQRFPAWMWRNTVVAEFVDWLREHNGRQRRRGAPQTGFHGLDLYSLHRSMAEVIGYLDTVDPAAARHARTRYGCFDHTGGDDGQAYGFAAAFGAGRSCQAQAVRQLVELQRRGIARHHGDPERDERLLDAVRNASSVRDAEAYYRAMFTDRTESWNLRDRHMTETLDALLEHLRAADPGAPPGIVVWAHNSHVGDARATELGQEGQLTLGQLVRESYGTACRTIGFSTATGTVTAADGWDRPARRFDLRAPLAAGVEQLLSDTGIPEFMLRFDQPGHAREVLAQPRPQRAVGVVYLPHSERHSHYFHARVADEFDALIHLDRTRALKPLDAGAPGHAGTPETYPSGL